MRNAPLFSCCISVLLFAGCQDRQARQTEPEATVPANSQQSVPEFLGFTLGQAVPSMRPCERGADYGYASDGESVCFWPSQDSLESFSGGAVRDGQFMIEIPLRRIPNGVRTTAQMTVIDKEVHGLSLRSDGSRQTFLLDLLNEKFGKPDSLESKTLPPSGGESQWRTFHAAWFYRDGSIQMRGMSANPSAGWISASTIKEDEWVKRGNGKNADSF